MNKQINWLEGNIKEVVRVYHEVYGINNLTYEIYPDRVIILSNGKFFKAHYAGKIEQMFIFGGM